MGEKLLWVKFLDMFYMGTNDQIMQGGKLMVKRFQRPSQKSNRGLNLKSTFCTLCL